MKSLRQPRQTRWGNHHDLHARRKGHHDQHHLQRDQRSAHRSAHFHPRFAGQGHHAEHHWRKVAAIGGTRCLAVGFISLPAPRRSVFAKSPAIRIARSISGKLMLWKRAIRIGKKFWRRSKQCARSQKKSRKLCARVQPPPSSYRLPGSWRLRLLRGMLRG